MTDSGLGGDGALWRIPLEAVMDTTVQARLYDALPLAALPKPPLVSPEIDEFDDDALVREATPPWQAVARTRQAAVPMHPPANMVHAVATGVNMLRVRGVSLWLWIDWVWESAKVERYDRRRKRRTVQGPYMHVALAPKTVTGQVSAFLRERADVVYRVTPPAVDTIHDYRTRCWARLRSTKPDHAAAVLDVLDTVYSMAEHARLLRQADLEIDAMVERAQRSLAKGIWIWPR